MLAKSFSLKNSKGFSFIEVLITCVILTIAATIVIPSFISWMPSYTLKGMVNDLRSALQTSRMAAITHSQKQSLVFTKEADSYYYYFDLNDNGAFDSGESKTLFSNSKYQIAPGAPNGRVNWNGDAITKPFTLPGDKCSFFPNGTASSGSIYISTPETTYALSISNSGTIKVRKYDGETKKWQ